MLEEPKRSKILQDLLIMKNEEFFKVKGNLGDSDNEMTSVQDPKGRKEGELQNKDTGLPKAKV